MINFYNRRRCHLLGDTGYAQQPWMLTPFRQTEDNTPESRYNKAHCSDRNVVERTIGLLKERWRCINDERTLHYDYVKVAQFINGAVVLHNLCVLANLTHYAEGAHLLRNVNVNEEEPEEDDDDLDDEDVPEGRRQQRAILIRGQQVRQEIVNELELRRQ
ncbi:putative nuclease HARBI1 [Thrips palmi]|uniref:Nuclease HARBI1 n=1 Tax=Thrips palmi TaxID=161013 RepID=A0A6P8ZU96_THRPL|nr:putative nuclease HARBI1 [Thrips palmi]